MTTMTTYAHGVPSWVDLATPDPQAAKAFYAALFGWDYTDEPTGQPGVPYTMARLDGRSAAGMMQLSPEMAAAGMPPVWTTYVNVADLDVTAAKVEGAGGAVMQPPMDVMDSGRMAIVADPSGAVFGMWEAKAHIGAEVVNEHGALTWNELMTPDPSAIVPFYEAVFGWAAQTMPMEGSEYTVFTADGGDENGIAGAMAPPMSEVPAYWGVYFNVDDVSEAVAKATELGAQVMLEPTPFEGVGTLAALVDPQGAFFSLMTPEG